MIRDELLRELKKKNTNIGKYGSPDEVALWAARFVLAKVILKLVDQGFPADGETVQGFHRMSQELSCKNQK